MNYFHAIQNYEPVNAQETKDKEVILSLIDHHGEAILLRETAVAHVAVSAFVVNQQGNKALFIHHNQMNKWAWAGGHADGNADLLQVAINEVKEETGVVATPVSTAIAALDILPVDRHVKNGVYVNGHLHLDVAFLLVADDTQLLQMQVDEISAAQWLSFDQLVTPMFSDRDVALYQKLVKRYQTWKG